MKHLSKYRHFVPRSALAAAMACIMGCAGQDRAVKPGQESSGAHSQRNQSGEYSDAMAGSDAERAEAALQENAARSENRGPVAPRSARSGQRAVDQPRVGRP